MAVVVYSFWDDHIVDNRGRRFFEIDENPGFGVFDEFNPGNPVTAFFGGKGFYIFDENINVLEGIYSQIARAASESCGKCTPCRVGLQILKSYLYDLLLGEKGSSTFEEIKMIAAQVAETSLCGLGQTATIALLGLLNNFPDEVENFIGSKTESEIAEHYTYVTAPCIEACPSKVNVPEYIDYIKEGKFNHSLGVVLQKYPMAATCGRVCVRFCEEACRRTQVDEAVGIKVLKRFVADKQSDLAGEWFSPDLIKDKKDASLKVAIIGTGPAGISAAYHMLLKGYSVDVFEAMTEGGGMAAVGIPEYRLPKNVLRREIAIIEALGGKIHYNQRLGEHYTVQDLYDRGYKSVFLGIGAHKGKDLKIPGEDRSVEGYIAGVKFLLFINHYYIDIGIDVDMGEKMVIVGGGNVAMDCARSAMRMGAKEVHVIYRRTEEDMPADREEIEAAHEEGIQFHFLTHPTKIITENDKVKGIELVKMAQGTPDASGRKSVRPVNGSEFVLETDFVIPAIGQAVDLSFLRENDGIDINRWGLIEVDDTSLMTSRKGVFAGGDCVTGPATLIEAMSQGEKAARAMDAYLSHACGRVRFNPEKRMSEILDGIKQADAIGVKVPVKAEYRIKINELDADVRKRLFEEVEKPITVEEAYAEADRCMRCYRVYSVMTENRGLTLAEGVR